MLKEKYKTENLLRNRIAKHKIGTKMRETFSSKQQKSHEMCAIEYNGIKLKSCMEWEGGDLLENLWRNVCYHLFQNLLPVSKYVKVKL
jgi:hypothetical protein